MLRRETNLTTTLLQHIPIFNRQDSSKLEDWLIDIVTATDILKESHMYLAEAKSCGLTHITLPSSLFTEVLMLVKILKFNRILKVSG